MNETNIRKYAALMKELDLTGLEITEGSKIVRLERNIQMPAGTAQATPDKTIVQVKEETPADYVSIKSPIVGVFYAAPAENADPYVAAGSEVKKGQTLCIIEAMKLMNEITAEQDGVILDVCVTNGQVVEYGTELFRLRRVSS